MPLAAVANEARAADDWVAAMRAGDFARAWEISDGDLAAVRRSGPGKHEGPRHLQRIWRGEALQGRRVLVRCYHGLGDTIQFARFLLPLRRIASEVIVWCQPELLPLIDSVEGADRVLPLHEGTPGVEFDVDVEIMEIPHAIRASRQQVEMYRPYLKVPSHHHAAENADGGTISVGMVWDVGDWDRRRVVPSRLLKRLDHDGVQLYSLQLGPAASARADIGAIDISTPDIVGLADRLQQMDLCVCPDTMVAHLSAALGRETWIMLHADCDWRWPAAGSGTFWYPTVRLFRQRIAGDWDDVVTDISSALSQRARQHRNDRERLSQRKTESSGTSAAPADCDR
jgi:hypothetical protein